MSTLRAVHDLHPPAGGRPQAPPQRQPGDAARQGLYERGYITYMRTDNVVLSDEALAAVRSEVGRTYGNQVPVASAAAVLTKIKNGQEAHEAIRPTTPLRSPDACRAQRPGAMLYRMIWQRTLASQMADATGTTVSVRLGAVATVPGGEHRHRRRVRPQWHHDHVPRLPAGVRRVRRTTTATTSAALLPPRGRRWSTGVAHAERSHHQPTGAPPRPRSSSASKNSASADPPRGIDHPDRAGPRLRVEEGPGACSHVDRARRCGLMEKHFDDLVDYAFTARVEEDLDSIARAERGRLGSRTSYFGGDEAEQLPGLEAARGREPRRDRRCGDQHVPDRSRSRRRRDRGEARQVRPVRETGQRGHRERARRPHA
ncbi:MAG: DNA topoisomerase [Ilumatobacteraceae bacterium]